MIEKAGRRLDVTSRTLIFQIILSILLITAFGITAVSASQAEKVDIVRETFATQSWNAGLGWPDNWYHEGDASIVSAKQKPHVVQNFTLVDLGGGTVTPDPSGPKASPIFGVTIDDISNRKGIKASLANLSRRPYARVVFDEYMEPSYYKETVADFHTVAGIMGEILDSYYVKDYSQQAYEQRTRDYVNAMAGEVDIWEVGNEINGHWLGPGAMAKAAAAYDIVKAAGEPAALTLYYNGTYDNGQETANNCWPKNGSAYQMQVWAEKNVPERMKKGLDWVLVSFYEEDCNNIVPNWELIFAQLHTMFPNSKVGFGEVGSKHADRKEATIRKYYGMDRIRPEFIGGFFWWYFNQDMVPNDTALWKTLNDFGRSWDTQYK